MLGDAQLGAVLRGLREGRDLTLAAVARRAGCVESTMSYMECGHRRLQPWLAQELDRIYATGGMIAALASGVRGKTSGDPTSGVPGSEVFVVLLPQGGVTMPLFRREVMTALGLGVVTGGLQGQFERALDGIDLDGDVLSSFQASFDGFKEAIRVLPPAQVIDAMTGQVAVLDGLRRRVADGERHRYSTLQAHYAESLSWLSEEAGDLPGAMWWVDRASQWAQAAGWTGMTTGGFVRRSMMVMSFSSDGLRAVDQARPVLDMPQASPRMKGLAAKQMAAGYALAGNRNESRRALDAAMDFLAKPVREDDAALGQLIVINDDLLAVYQTTCDVYLGYGARVIPVLEPRLESLAKSSFRRATITRAKLARAYANAGQPADACRLAEETLDAVERIDSQSARSELRRTVRVLDQWHGRSDVQDLTHRLGSRTLTT
ncbi:MAG: helix-turn-helix domain-containing protein [Pseudonocardiaceae bacterium]